MLGNILFSVHQAYVCVRSSTSQSYCESNVNNVCYSIQCELSVICEVTFYSYATMFLPKEHSGSLASLRTFRVLRALKTVAVIPGELDDVCANIFIY